MNDPHTAMFGGGQLQQDPQTGAVTWDGSEVIIMRVKLINQLFGRILKIPAFSTLLRDAGITAGVDYANAFMVGNVPRAGQGAQAINSNEQIAQFWERMNEQDAFSGWGRATLVAVDKAAATATIHVTASFTGREVAYWTEKGFGGTKVCSFLEGYFLGEARILLGRQELTCEETHCQLDGYSTLCEFQISPIDGL